MKKDRFMIGCFETTIPTYIYDMESGAEVITFENNHDWFWVDDEVDREWSDERYVMAIAGVIAKALNESDIPRPNLKDS